MVINERDAAIIFGQCRNHVWEYVMNEHTKNPYISFEKMLLDYEVKLSELYRLNIALAEAIPVVLQSSVNKKRDDVIQKKREALPEVQ